MRANNNFVTDITGTVKAFVFGVGGSKHESVQTKKYLNKINTK